MNSVLATSLGLCAGVCIDGVTYRIFSSFSIADPAFVKRAGLARGYTTLWNHAMKINIGLPIVALGLALYMALIYVSGNLLPKTIDTSAFTTGLTLGLLTTTEVLKENLFRGAGSFLYNDPLGAPTK